MTVVETLSRDKENKCKICFIGNGRNFKLIALFKTERLLSFFNLTCGVNFIST